MTDQPIALPTVNEVAECIAREILPPRVQSDQDRGLPVSADPLALLDAWGALSNCARPSALLIAVRAVLELHYSEPYAQGPDYCAECEHRYPCETVTAITTALEAS